MGQHGAARVLIADDDLLLAQLVAEMVADAGYVPMVTADGSEALTKAQEQCPDLVLTDLWMLNLDGAGLARELRLEAKAQGRPMPPVILITAACPTYDEEASADALLRKPLYLDALLHRFLDRVNP